MLVFDSVTKSFAGPGGAVPVLHDFSARIHPGELAVIQGPSGCGKSTLLFTAGTMLPPDSGRILLEGQSLYELSRRRRNRLRGSSIGFIFQRFHLIPYLTARQNILWPLRWCADSAAAAARLPGLARRLHLSGRLGHRPAQLRAGEQQRVAVARALLGRKKLICADEPTGNLDQDSGAIILAMLQEEAARGAIVLFVTHQHCSPTTGTLGIRWNAEGSPNIKSGKRA